MKFKKSKAIKKIKGKNKIIKSKYSPLKSSDQKNIKIKSKVLELNKIKNGNSVIEEIEQNSIKKNNFFKKEDNIQENFKNPGYVLYNKAKRMCSLAYKKIENFAKIFFLEDFLD